jgi:hypothetical protein
VAETNQSPADDTVLMAEVRVHLYDAESFELLPFVDAKDVNSKVGELPEDWSKSGFLLRGSQIIPWHRVRLVEATRVEEVTPAEANRRLSERNEQNPAQFQESFWKTKEPIKKKDQGGGASKAM